MNAVHLLPSASTPSCSGRNSLKNVHLRITTLPKWFVPCLRAPSLVVRALYNFADSAEVSIPGQRRNRGLLKKEAREIMDVVRGLTSMTSKQLFAVSHLLPMGTVEAVGIAARLPRSNQGRKRQEGLVAKMLRGQLSEQQMAKLEAAVAVATKQQGIYDDSDVSGLVEGVVAEVYGYPAAWGLDHQQLRLLVRQCRQALEEEHDQEGRQESSAAGPSSSSGSSMDSCADRPSYEQEEEDLAAVLVQAAAHSRGGGGGGGRGHRKAKAPEPRSRALVRSVGKMLRSLAIRVVEEGLGGPRGGVTDGAVASNDCYSW